MKKVNGDKQMEIQVQERQKKTGRQTSDCKNEVQTRARTKINERQTGIRRQIDYER